MGNHQAPFFGFRNIRYAQHENMRGFHTNFAVDRATGYGIVILMAGKYTNAAALAAMAAGEYLHTAFKHHLVKANVQIYVGTYGSSSHGLFILIKEGALWVERILVNGAFVIAHLKVLHLL